MKRYFVVNEFFGIRVYDSIKKKEFYYDKETSEQIKKMLDDQYILIDNLKKNNLSAPLKISMNLTKKCNLRCVQCFSDSGTLKEQELTTKDIYKLFDDMCDNGTFFICLGGGEPFTRPDLLDILKYGKNKKLAISVVTNGLLLNKEKIEKLNELDIDYLWLSFEGLKNNHEKLRGEGTFDKILDTLQQLKDNYDGKTAIRMSVNKYNIDECEEMVKLAENYEVDLIRFTPLLSFGRAKDKDLVINQIQYIKFLNNVRNIKSQNVDIIYPNMDNNYKIWIGKNGFGCHCGKEAIWIDEVGRVSPCIFWGENYNIGNIKDEKYMNLWNKCIKISSLKGNSVCKNCKNYKICRGGCRARSLELFGNLDEIDPLCPLKKNLINQKK